MYSVEHCATTLTKAWPATASFIKQETEITLYLYSSRTACACTHTAPLLSLLGCTATGQSASLVATADWESGRSHPLPMFWNILLSMRIHGILFQHMAESIKCLKKSLACS